MSWVIFLILLVISLMIIVIVNYLRDRRASKSRTSELISPELWDEIEAEREAEMEKARKFKEALFKAQQKIKRS